MTGIKICGLSNTLDIEAVNLLMPDYIGFVFAESNRQISDMRAKKLKKVLNKHIKAVGVFVNERIDNIVSICEQGIIDMIQIHGDEDEEYIKRLKSRTEKPVIRAFRIRSMEDIRAAQGCCADYILLDSFREGAYGGSGHMFPWDLTKEIGREFFLAGGIHLSNVIEAVTTCHPYCIDVSSGVETRGLKDREKIREIIRRVRSVR